MTGLGLAVYHGLYSSIILIITGIRPSCPGWPISDRIPPIHQHDNNSWYSPHSSGLLIEKVRVEHCSAVVRDSDVADTKKTQLSLCLYGVKAPIIDSFCAWATYHAFCIDPGASIVRVQPMRAQHLEDPDQWECSTLEKVACVYIWGDIITTLVWPAAHCWPPDSKYPELGGKRKREREGGGGTLWI